ncbi:MAG: sigma-70 family RNA polymerase sigma factor [Clostridiales bacterium]|nr:sigma-70 family RNA polymerase sigma factor [Clostridiales bacterium]
MNPDHTRALLRAAQKGDRAACGQLVEENQGLIWSLVHRYARKGMDSEDLYQLGCLGFLKAVQGFDLDYGTQFSTYAVPKIAGEIRRFLRDDGMIRVGRGKREQALRLHKAREDLQARLGRDPALSELAQATGMTPEEIAAADLAAAAVISLQAESGETGLALEMVVGSESLEEGMVETVALRTAIDRLPERERKLILLRYYKGLTQDKTARVLGISQVQVSRLEKKCLQILRRELED